MLATESENTLGGQSIQQRDGSNKERCDDAATIESDVADSMKNLHSKKIQVSRKDLLLVPLELFVWFRQLEFLSGMVRVKISEDNDCYEGILTMFELDGVMETQQLMAPSSLICLNHLKEFTLVLENHGCEPIYLQSGQILGHIENVLVKRCRIVGMVRYHQQ